MLHMDRVRLRSFVAWFLLMGVHRIKFVHTEHSTHVESVVLLVRNV